MLLVVCRVVLAKSGCLSLGSFYAFYSFILFGCLLFVGVENCRCCFIFIETHVYLVGLNLCIHLFLKFEQIFCIVVMSMVS